MDTKIPLEGNVKSVNPYCSQEGHLLDEQARSLPFSAVPRRNKDEKLVGL